MPQQGVQGLLACWIETAIVAFLSTSCLGFPFPSCLRTTTNPRIQERLGASRTMTLRLVPNAWLVLDLMSIFFSLGMKPDPASTKQLLILVPQISRFMYFIMFPYLFLDEYYIRPAALLTRVIT